MKLIIKGWNSPKVRPAWVVETDVPPVLGDVELFFDIFGKFATVFFVQGRIDRVQTILEGSRFQH